ncbi:hypothetical protein ACVV2G_29015 [Streptomyces ziwulingensis]
MRGIDQGLDGETEGYWLHDYVTFGSYDVTSDGLLMDCRTERGSFGAIGRFFDETGTRFGQADSLGGYLAELADTLSAARRLVSSRSTAGCSGRGPCLPGRSAVPTSPFPHRMSSCQSWTCPAVPPTSST